ncbi:zinc carboxypeptidase [Planoprotostelium fungivorum]|uniref:Zinc carboxypeptidase n=1 Tax=Planoprotostelium fungivorum TaxID=1890364 RepID=A0A2P6N304_9EUKA|nr:zinc carboxypeptidase [Planoprotostelium fungivorum]
MRNIILFLAVLACAAALRHESVAVLVKDEQHLQHLTKVVHARKRVEGSLEMEIVVTPKEKETLELHNFQLASIPPVVPETSIRTKRDVNSDDIAPHDYHDNNAIQSFFAELHKQYPDIASEAYSIGKSVQGQDIWAIDISENVEKKGKLEPEFKYVANMHGDETTGRELVLSFAHQLCSEYSKNNSRFVNFLQTTHISLVPTMNPDGFKLSQRENFRGIDLNRNFDDHFKKRQTAMQPEVEVMTRWIKSRHFVLSANFHGGAVVANYPWDGLSNGQFSQGNPSPCPDDDLFKNLASVYSENNSDMKNNHEFKDGITNGAAWYTLYGGMQDWNYVNADCFEITLEVSDNKYPPKNELAHYWELNKESMLSFAEQVHRGFKGVTTDAAGKPVAARVTVSGIDKDVRSRNGEYYRLLMPGTYSVTARSNGYPDLVQSVEVKEGQVARLDFVFGAENQTSQYSLRNVESSSAIDLGVQVFPNPDAESRFPYTVIVFGIFVVVAVIIFLVRNDRAKRFVSRHRETFAMFRRIDVFRQSLPRRLSTDTASENLTYRALFSVYKQTAALPPENAFSMAIDLSQLTEQQKGYAAVVGAILFFGSFAAAVPLKSRRVVKANVDPVVFQVYYSISIFLSSWIVLAWAHDEFRFTYYGFISAACWVPASILSIFAINHLGMSVAVGVWAGVTIVVSFIWGAFLDGVQSPRYSYSGIAVLVVGVLLLSLSSSEFVANLGKKKKDQNSTVYTPAYSPIHETSPLLHGEDKPKAINVDGSRKSYNDEPALPIGEPKKNSTIGLICAVLLGAMNGSMLVPMRGAPKDIVITFVISFSIGVLAITPVCALAYFLFRRQRPVWHVRVALVPGLLTGLIWSIGNGFSIYATTYLGLKLGFPLTQLALVVSGLWGIIVFREVTALASLVWWFVSLLVVGGGVALMVLATI